MPAIVADMLRVDRTGVRVYFRYSASQTPAGVEQDAVFSLLDHSIRFEETASSGSAEPAPAKLLRTLAARTRTVRLSGDGRLAVASLSDGTLRWYSAADGRELLALLPHEDRKRWIAWTPSGYYDASAEGESLLGWEVPRGRELSADFFPIGLFRKKLYRPDVTSRVLFLRNEEQALAAANAEAGTESPEVPISRLLPPIVTILTPADGAQIKSSALTLKVAVRSPSGESVTSLRVLVQGRLQNTREARALVPIPAPPKLADPQAVLYDVPVTLPQESCSLAILAETTLAKSEPALLHLIWTGARTRAASPADLYVLAVGTSKYRQPRLRLEYAAKDAQDLAIALKAQEGKRYRLVEQRVLTDEQATRNNILTGLAWLRQRTQPGDVAVFFLAGHGMSEGTGGKYYYLPYDAEPAAPADTMVDAGEIQSLLGSIRGKMLLFIDTCHSGSVLGSRRGPGGLGVNRFVNELASIDSGVIVYAASQADEASRESPRWKNGAFTKALVEGLRGQADYGARGQITVSSLEYYISNRVQDLTQQEQTPTTAKPITVPDFLIATVAHSVPVYKKWWLWTLAGMAAAGGVALGVGLYARGPDTSGVPALRPFAN
jgi:hypothetical protein